MIEQVMHYTIRINLSFGVIFILFILLNNKRSLPILNRFFILFSPILAMLLPLIQLPLSASWLQEIKPNAISTGEIMSLVTDETHKAGELSKNPGALPFIVFYLWIAGILAGAILTFRIFYKHLKIVNKYGIKELIP